MRIALTAVLAVLIAGACSPLGHGGAASPSTSPTGPALAQASGPLDAQVAPPADFPSDVPVYPGARLTAGAGFNSGGVVSWGMEWETLDSIDKVHSFYAAKFSQGDWTINFTASNSTAFSAAFQRKSNPNAKGVIGADDSSGVTKVSLYFASPS